MRRIGIIFDMDGVIVNNNSYHYQAWKQLAAKYGKEINPDNYREHMNGRTLDELMEYIFNEPMPKEKAREIGMEKEAIYRNLYQPHITPTKGLLKLIGDAADQGIEMVVGTSAPVENVVFTMNGLGIRHYFKDILDDRAVTKGKPNPEIYQKCAQAINLPNESCVVFEDAISGIKAGRAAGSKVIALATSHKRDELSADMIIDDFTQINLKQIVDLIGN